jgi:hypothetical protein
MKADMGDKIYKQRQDKMDYKADAPMYNKDTQPNNDGVDTKQYNKFKSKFNSNKGIDETYMVIGKYNDYSKQTKFIDFDLNESIKLEKINENLFKLSLDGLGNKYDHSINENRLFESINNLNFFTDGIKVYYIKHENTLNESVNTKTEKVFNEPLLDPVAKATNPRDKDMAPSRQGKGTGEGNKPQEEVTTRPDQLAKQ